MLQFLRTWTITKVFAMEDGSKLDIPSTNTSMEFAVQLHCQKCVDGIYNKLSTFDAVSKIQISLEKESVVVETSLPSSVIKNIIEDTGRKVVLKGIGGSKHNLPTKHLGAAVAVLGCSNTKNIGFGWGDGLVCGVVRFIQANEEECIIEGALDGLSPGLHGIHIHECGDLSQGCYSIGNHYNPFNCKHGGPNQDNKNRHVGDLGNINADENGHATFRIVDNLVKTWDLIGRSVVVTEKEDDLGVGGHPNSSIDGNSGQRLACGIVARSAGLFENPKRICACDGVTIWDEESNKANKNVNITIDTSANNPCALNDSDVNQKSKY